MTKTFGLEFPFGSCNVNWRFFGELGAEKVIISQQRNKYMLLDYMLYNSIGNSWIKQFRKLLKLNEIVLGRAQFGSLGNISVISRQSFPNFPGQAC